MDASVKKLCFLTFQNHKPVPLGLMLDYVNIPKDLAVRFPHPKVVKTFYVMYFQRMYLPHKTHAIDSDA